MSRTLRQTLRQFLRREDGVAAAEIALWAAALVPVVFSSVELANYSYRKMQVNEAAQAAAQRAWLHCYPDATKLPLTNCTGVSAAMTTAAQATGLGTGVTVTATTDGYYCANSSSALVLVGTIGSLSTAPTKPSTCTSVTAGSTAAPGEYIVVSTSYTYAPLFGSLSITALLPTAVTRSAWLRLA